MEQDKILAAIKCISLALSECQENEWRFPGRHTKLEKLALQYSISKKDETKEAVALVWSRLSDLFDIVSLQKILKSNQE